MTPPDGRPRGPDPVPELLLAGSLILVACVAWWIARPAIVGAVFGLADAMLAGAGWFTARFEPLRAQIAGTDPGDPAVTPSRLWRLLSLAGGPWAWPAAALLGACAVACFRKAGARRFTRDLDLDGLLREQAEAFPTGAPFAARKLGLVEPRPDGPPRPLDPALHLPEWVDRFARGADGRYCDAMAQVALAAQLGPLRPCDTRRARPIHRVLFAAFALHAARETAAALDLLGAAARALPGPAPGEDPAGPDAPLPLDPAVVALADEVLADPDVRLPCEAVARRHAFAAPALMSVLCHARLRAGVLNPGLFAWTRLVDRPLFMALDSLGVPVAGIPWHRGPAPAPLVEGAAARDHWARELEAGRPLSLPAVGSALAAVRSAAGQDAGVDGRERA